MNKLLCALVLILLVFTPSISNSNIVEELTKLNNLYKDGAINEEEFSKAKSILLKSEQSNETNEAEVKKNVKKKEKKEETKSSSKISKKKQKPEDIQQYEDLTNTYASLEDVEEFGNFEKINYSPQGMFDKKKHKSLFIVTPGIRLPGDKKDDQSRVVTPRDALFKYKADAIVIGRSLTRYNVKRNLKKLIDHLNK